MHEQDEAASLTAWRDAVAATDAIITDNYVYPPFKAAVEREMRAGRAYLAARDRAVTGQGRDEHVQS